MIGHVHLLDKAIMPPWTKRSDEQKSGNRYAKKKLRSGNGRTLKSGAERRTTVQTLGAILP